ncbi:hypothetical protein SNEBB_008668 [Seison nebaliae]|nr:hypothetical protein SNEBB_008668 [Seison nebaliae]
MNSSIQDTGLFLLNEDISIDEQSTYDMNVAPKRCSLVNDVLPLSFNVAGVHSSEGCDILSNSLHLLKSRKVLNRTHASLVKFWMRYMFYENEDGLSFERRFVSQPSSIKEPILSGTTKEHTIIEEIVSEIQRLKSHNASDYDIGYKIIDGILKLEESMLKLTRSNSDYHNKNEENSNTRHSSSSKVFSTNYYDYDYTPNEQLRNAFHSLVVNHRASSEFNAINRSPSESIESQTKSLSNSELDQIFTDKLNLILNETNEQREEELKKFIHLLIKNEDKKSEFINWIHRNDNNAILNGDESSRSIENRQILSIPTNSATYTLEGAYQSTKASSDDGQTFKLYALEPLNDYLFRYEFLINNIELFIQSITKDRLYPIKSNKEHDNDDTINRNDNASLVRETTKVRNNKIVRLDISSTAQTESDSFIISPISVSESMIMEKTIENHFYILPKFSATQLFYDKQKTLKKIKFFDDNLISINHLICNTFDYSYISAIDFDLDRIIADEELLMEDKRKQMIYINTRLNISNYDLMRELVVEILNDVIDDLFDLDEETEVETIPDDTDRDVDTFPFKKRHKLFEPFDHFLSGKTKETSDSEKPNLLSTLNPPHDPYSILDSYLSDFDTEIETMPLLREDMAPDEMIKRMSKIKNNKKKTFKDLFKIKKKHKDKTIYGVPSPETARIPMPPTIMSTVEPDIHSERRAKFDLGSEKDQELSLNQNSGTSYLTGDMKSPRETKLRTTADTSRYSFATDITTEDKGKNMSEGNQDPLDTFQEMTDFPKIIDPESETESSSRIGQRSELHTGSSHRQHPIEDTSEPNLNETNSPGRVREVNNYILKVKKEKKNKNTNAKGPSYTAELGRSALDIPDAFYADSVGSIDQETLTENDISEVTDTKKFLNENVVKGCVVWLKVIGKASMDGSFFYDLKHPTGSKCRRLHRYRFPVYQGMGLNDENERLIYLRKRILQQIHHLRSAQHFLEHSFTFWALRCYLKYEDDDVIIYGLRFPLNSTNNYNDIIVYDTMFDILYNDNLQSTNDDDQLLLETIRNIAAQLLVIIAYFHNSRSSFDNITLLLLNSLRLSNLLVCSDGYLCLRDLEDSLVVNTNNAQSHKWSKITSSANKTIPLISMIMPRHMVGPEYSKNYHDYYKRNVPPLVMCKSQDIYSFGCILFELLSRRTLFPELCAGQANDSVLNHLHLNPSSREVWIQRRLARCKMTNPKKKEFDLLYDLIKQTTKTDPYERLGCGRIKPLSTLFTHSFFKGINFDAISLRQIDLMTNDLKNRISKRKPEKVSHLITSALPHMNDDIVLQAKPAEWKFNIKESYLNSTAVISVKIPKRPEMMMRLTVNCELDGVAHNAYSHMNVMEQNLLVKIKKKYLNNYGPIELIPYTPIHDIDETLNGSWYPNTTEQQNKLKSEMKQMIDIDACDFNGRSSDVSVIQKNFN